MASRVVLLLLLLLCFQLTASLPPELPGGDDTDAPTLLKIKKQFGNPPDLRSWRPGTDHCLWWFGAKCDERRRVVYLVFRGRNITSTLPPAIGGLDQLQLITIVDMPGLSGPIPDSFGNLRHLTTLTIARTSISGAIPASLSRATSLTEINLSGNKLAGSIPRSLQSMPRLAYFNAVNNYLTGTIPSRLVRGGTAGSPAAQALSNNRLMGTIPWTYGVERNLMQLWVANNKLAGDASFLFGRRKAMVCMDLSGNRLRFNLTGVEMPAGLQAPSLARNRIYGLLESDLVH